MEPAQAKPLRRRRRWLIVAFVLVLVSMVSWWYYPRGDARFVGKWSWADANDKKPPTTFVQLHRNGSGTFKYRVDKGPPDDFGWRVADNRLIMQRPRFRDAGEILWGARQWWDDGEWPSAFDDEVYDILNVGHDSILLKTDLSEGDSMQVIFRRIPE